MLYRIDDFELDTDNFELRQAGVARHVEPLVFDLILYLSTNPGRTLSRDEIIDHVWQGRIVSDTTISSAVKSARKALGDSGETQKYIRTIRGRGFQFLGDVCGTKPDSGDVEKRTAQAPGAPKQPSDMPSLIVLPFQTFGEECGLSTFADGLVENLTTILTRVPLLSVTSRSMSFALKDQQIFIDDIRDRFRVNYMLEGSVQRIAGKICANVQLIETTNGFHIWAQQFNVDENDEAVINLLHDILPRLEPQLTKAMFNDLRDESGELSSRQLLLQSMGLLSLKGWHKDTFIEASTLLRKAITLEPDLALAHAYLALILGLGHRVGLLRTSGDIIDETLAAAELAMELDGMDSDVLGLAACALADVGQADRAIPILKNAIEINPNNAQGLAALGAAYMVLGQIEPAIKYLRQGIDISPHDSRLAVWNAVLGVSYLYAGEFELAKEAAEDGCQNNDTTYLPRVVLTAAFIGLGHEREAKRAYKECTRVKPDLSLDEICHLVGPEVGAKIGALLADN